MAFNQEPEGGNNFWASIAEKVYGANGLQCMVQWKKLEESFPKREWTLGEVSVPQFGFMPILLSLCSQKEKLIAMRVTGDSWLSVSNKLNRAVYDCKKAMDTSVSSPLNIQPIDWTEDRVRFCFNLMSIKC